MIKDFSNKKYHPEKEDRVTVKKPKKFSFRFGKFKLRKDYSEKKYVNPYFEEKKVPIKGFNTQRYLKILAGAVIIYILVYSSLFRVSAIEVSGNELISQEEFINIVKRELKNNYFFVIPQSNFVLLSERKLEKGIREKYDLSELKIRRGWKKLKISLKENISNLLVFNRANQSFYFADQEGRVTQIVPREIAEKFWLKYPILNVNNLDLKEGDDIASSKTVEFILKLDEAIVLAGIERNGYELKGDNEVDLVSKKDWRAYFDVNSDVQRSVDNLSLVLKEKVGGQKIQYVDLRFGDKVYYK
ncbi:MAG: hypothetical protein AAB791_03000 [Patescibacteria group bacterium]